MSLTGLINAYQAAEYTIQNEDPALADDIRNYCLAQIRVIVGATAPAPPTTNPVSLEGYINNLYNTVDTNGSLDHNTHLGGTGEMEGIWVNLGLPRSEFHALVGSNPEQEQLKNAVINAMITHLQTM